MTVKEAIAMFAYGTEYEIKGAFSGKIYHRSRVNSRKNLEKYVDMDVTDSPFYATLVVRGNETSNSWCSPCIGIWMYDHELCKKKEGATE